MVNCSYQFQNDLNFQLKYIWIRDQIVVLKKIIKVAWIRRAGISLSEIQKEDMPPCGILIILLNWNVKKKL